MRRRAGGGEVKIKHGAVEVVSQEVEIGIEVVGERGEVGSKAVKAGEVQELLLVRHRSRSRCCF